MNVVKEDFNVHCDGCGRMVHEADVFARAEDWDPDCELCAFCKDKPEERAAFARGFNRGMDKLAEARRIQQFRLDDNFQATFDRWAADVEAKERGKLVITHEEVIHDGIDLLIFYRVDPNPAIARRR
jgi:hypothetical protein